MYDLYHSRWYKTCAAATSQLVLRYQVNVRDLDSNCLKAFSLLYTATLLSNFLCFRKGHVAPLGKSIIQTL